jgi:hypothetical protein
VNEIQRCFRGHCGRTEAHRRRNGKYSWQQLSLLHYLCSQVQRCFRGYHSRKYIQDQARRKQYCRMIETKGKQVLQQMEDYYYQQSEVRSSYATHYHFV